jgi:hypothetical protein
MRTAIIATVTFLVTTSTVFAETNPNEVLERMRDRLQRDCPDIAREDHLKQCYEFALKEKRGTKDWLSCVGVVAETQQRMSDARTATCRASLTEVSIEGYDLLFAEAARAKQPILTDHFLSRGQAYLSRAAQGLSQDKKADVARGRGLIAEHLKRAERKAGGAPPEYFAAVAMVQTSEWAATKEDGRGLLAFAEGYAREGLKVAKGDEQAGVMNQALGFVAYARARVAGSDSPEFRKRLEESLAFYRKDTRKESTTLYNIAVSQSYLGDLDGAKQSLIDLERADMALWACADGLRKGEDLAALAKRDPTWMAAYVKKHCDRKK